jgi:hypothetical protein
LEPSLGWPAAKAKSGSIDPKAAIPVEQRNILRFIITACEILGLLPF